MSFCTQCGKPLRAGASGCEFCQPASRPARPSLNVAAAARVAVSHTLFIASAHTAQELDKGLQKHLAKPLDIVRVDTPEMAHQAARQAVQRLLPRGDLKYVCLIGDWSEVPPFKVDNPSRPCRGQDPFCWTDALYGLRDAYQPEDILTAIAPVAVGRIPSTDMAIVLPALLEAPVSVDPGVAFAFAVSAQCWSEATQTIVQGFTDSTSAGQLFDAPDFSGLSSKGVLASPDWEEDDLRREISDAGISPGAVLLFNVHGSADEPHWVGEGDWGYTEIMQTDTVEDFNQAILLSEACYGGAMGYDEPSMVESFFTKGGKAFVGCSVIAWGSSGSALCGADLIALHFFKALREGQAFGEALNSAKRATLDATYVHDEVSQKTVLSFNLFGAPWHQLKRAAAASVLPTAAPQGSMLDRIRSRRAGGDAAGGSALERVRDNYRGRLSSQAQRFLLERDDALRQLSGFKDREKIESFLGTLQVDFDDCDFEEIRFEDAHSFRISGKSKKFPSTKELFILAINGEGELTHQLTTKGSP